MCSHECLCPDEGTIVKWSYREGFRNIPEFLWHLSDPPVSQGVVLPSKEVAVSQGWVMFFPLERGIKLTGHGFLGFRHMTARRLFIHSKTFYKQTLTKH